MSSCSAGAVTGGAGVTGRAITAGGGTGASTTGIACGCTIVGAAGGASGGTGGNANSVMVRAGGSGAGAGAGGCGKDSICLDGAGSTKACRTGIFGSGTGGCNHVGASWCGGAGWCGGASSFGGAGSATESECGSGAGSRISGNKVTDNGAGSIYRRASMICTNNSAAATWAANTVASAGRECGTTWWTRVVTAGSCVRGNRVQDTNRGAARSETAANTCVDSPHAQFNQCLFRIQGSSGVKAQRGLVLAGVTGGQSRTTPGRTRPASAGEDRNANYYHLRRTCQIISRPAPGPGPGQVRRRTLARPFLSRAPPESTRTLPDPFLDRHARQNRTGLRT